MQRRRIEIDAHAGHQRQHQPDGEPERVEHRQHVEHLVLAAEVDRAAACAVFAIMLRWVSTTPFGNPSEPEVNSTAAQSSGLRATSGFLQFKKPRSLSIV